VSVCVSVCVLLAAGTYGPLQAAYTADIAKANPSALHSVEKKVCAAAAAVCAGYLSCVLVCSAVLYCAGYL
jgi:hypothetical protein